MRIECSSCEMYQSHHCDDCLVTALLHPQADAVEIDAQDERLGHLGVRKR